MDIINYQFADPEQIQNLKDADFIKLVKDKIYVLNSRFIQSQQCMELLLQHINFLPPGKQTLKIIKDLVKFFQSPILYCLKQFYQKHQKYFQSLTSPQKSESSANSALKELRLLQQIGSIYVKLTDSQEEIEELSFLKKYGVSNKDVSLAKKDEQYQKKYLRWLKKSLLGLKVLEESVLGEQEKTNWVQRTEKQFEELVQNNDSKWFQRFTLDDIKERSQEILDFHKNISKKQIKDNSSLLKMKQNQNKAQKGYQQNQNDSYDSQEQIVKNQEIKNKAQNLSSISPSFRRFFYQDENILHSEDTNLEYKNFRAPYDKYCVMQLRRAICAFLNRGGGVILVGVKEDLNDKSRVIKGQILSEYKKQEVLIEYKYICQQIEPDIISQGKYRIKFVPIKRKNGAYIQGKYIVRVQVSKGDNKNFYTVHEDNEDFVMLRTANEVLKRSITQKTLANFKLRLFDSLKHPPLAPCPEPEIGIPLLEDKNKSKFNEKHEYCDDEDEYEDCYRNPYFQNRNKWRLKAEPVSPATKETKGKDYVYFNSVKEQAKNNNEVQKTEDIKISNKNEFKKKKFICDEQENEDDIDEKQIESDSQMKCNNENKQSLKFLVNSFTTYQNKIDKTQQNDLDFQPINPVPPRLSYKQYQQSKQFYQPFQKKEKKYIPKPNSTKLQPYKVERAPLQAHTQKPSSLDLLLIGIPFDTVNQKALQMELPLIQPAIQCNNDFVTWLSINIRLIQTIQKVNNFILLIQNQLKKIPAEKQKRQVKIRKLYSNVYFQEQILLNAFIDKFRHNQQFCDDRGTYYFACKDNHQAIQAYMIGYDLDFKIKFISSEDLKARKLEYLRSKVQKKQNQKNKQSLHQSNLF